MPVLELLDDRDDRGRLGRVALVAADLQREPDPVDQQTHDNLRVDPAFLGVADLAQLVLLLGLEVQRRHVIQAQRDIPAGGGMREARGRDLVAVTPFLAAAQGPEHGAQRAVLDADLFQHTHRVRLACRLHDPGQHELLERRIVHDVEPEPVVHAHQHVPQHRRPLPDDHPQPALVLHPRDLQIQRLLTRLQSPTGLGQQHRKLGLRPRRPHVLEDVVAPVAALSDLDLRGARAASRLPNERHNPDPTDDRGTSNQPARKPLTSTNTGRTENQPSSGTSQAGRPGQLARTVLAVAMPTKYRCGHNLRRCERSDTPTAQARTAPSTG